MASELGRVASSNAMDSNKPSDMWNGSVGGGWDAIDNSSPKCEGTGWGSPSPSPNPSAGTESWGQPTAKQTQPQAWGSAQESAKVPGSDWGHAPETKPTPNPTGWNQQPQASASSSGWGESESKGSDTGSWDGQTELSNHTNNTASWSQSDINSPVGAITATNSANVTPAESTLNTLPASRPISSSWGSSSSAPSIRPPASNPQGAWGEGSPFNKVQGGAWAQPTGRPLTNDPSYTNQPGSEVELAKEKFIAAAVNSADGWGNRSVRQDTGWCMEDAAAVPAAAPPVVRRKNSGEEEAQWNGNSNGTAIWESSKESGSWQRSHSRSSSTSSGGANDWGGSDNDSGTWNGPPGMVAANNNQWRGDNQQPSQQWMNKPEATNSWEKQNSARAPAQPPPPQPQVEPNSRSWMEQQSQSIPGRPMNNQWSRDKPEGNVWPGNANGGEGKGDDNTWDRDGTNVWGETETGSWAGKAPRSIQGNNGQYWPGGNPQARPGSWENQNAAAPMNMQRSEAREYWPDGQNATGPKKWQEDVQPSRWITQQPPPPPQPPTVNSSTWVNPTPPPNPNISLDGTHIWNKQKPAVSICLILFLNRETRCVIAI